MTDTPTKAPREHVSAQVVIPVVIIILGSALGNLSQTAMNAMFGGIAADFKVDMALGQWVTTLYMLVIGITVPVVTYLMRRFALKRLTIFSLCLFAFGCIVDVFAPSFVLLLVGRALQAVSAGILMPRMMSIIMTSFPPNKRATVMGVAGIAMGFAPNIGPTIGGYLVTASGWRSLFVILAICMIVLIICACVFIVRSPRIKRTASLDVVSVILSALGFGFLLLGFSNASDAGAALLSIWVPILIGVIALVAFIRRQKRIDDPLINMDIFTSKQFVVGFWASNFLYASFMGITLIVPLFIENIWGGTALEAGLVLLPGTIAALFINPLAGYLTDRFHARPVIVLFGACLAFGSVAMAFMDASTPFWLILLLQGIRACGVSGLVSPLTSWSMEELAPNRMPDASSFSTAIRQAIASMGTALMVFSITLGAQAFGSLLFGFQLALGLSGVFALALFVIALVRVR